MTKINFSFNTKKTEQQLKKQQQEVKRQAERISIAQSGGTETMTAMMGV